MTQNPGLQDPNFQFTNPKCLIMIAFHILRVFFSTKFSDNNFQFTKKLSVHINRDIGFIHIIFCLIMTLYQLIHQKTLIHVIDRIHRDPEV